MSGAGAWLALDWARDVLGLWIEQTEGCEVLIGETPAHSFGVHSGEGDHEVVLHFTGFAADYIREKRWHPSQQLKELKDGVELRLRLSGLIEVQRWIMGWGGNVKVIAPKELIASVRAAARQLVADHAG